MIWVAILALLPDFALSTSSRLPELGTFESTVLSNSLMRLTDFAVRNSGVYSTATPTERFFQIAIFDLTAAAYFGDFIHITGKGLRVKEFGGSSLRYAIYPNSILLGWRWRRPTLSYVPTENQASDELKLIASAGFEADYLSSDYLLDGGHAVFYLYERLNLPVYMALLRRKVAVADSFFRYYHEGDELLSCLMFVSDGDYASISKDYDKHLMLLWLHEILNMGNWAAVGAIVGYIRDGRPPILRLPSFSVSTSYILTPNGFQGVYRFDRGAWTLKLRVSEHTFEAVGLGRRGDTGWYVELFAPHGAYFRVEKRLGAGKNFMFYLQGKSAGFVPGMPIKRTVSIGVGFNI